MSSPDLFVVCKSCQAEVSPYITECPYCGTRLRKRAPRIERADAPPKPPPARRRRVPRPRSGARAPRPERPPKAAPRLGRMRSGEIPGIRGDEHSRPYATFVLVALSFGVWLSLAFFVAADFAVSALRGDPWRFVTAALLNDGTAAQFAAVLGIGLFGWLLERRYGPLAVVGLFLACGPVALAIASAVDPGTLVFGSHGAALGMLCAWLVPVLAARSRGAGDDDVDLLGVAVVAVVLVLVPLVSQGSALAGLFGAALGALGGLALAATARARP